MSNIFATANTLASGPINTSLPATKDILFFVTMTASMSAFALSIVSVVA
ncbi:MAG: hypothetical protein GY951_06985 [Psychromonas sp.]|nr:hypothetical protein [Alteromonadales bacterium]MCP5077787.1 hypothetical protein [Psychromonas sp.]